MSALPPVSLDEARQVLLQWVPNGCTEALDVVLARLDELEFEGATTEWGVRYPDPPDKIEVTSEYALPDAEYDSVDRFPDESAARAEVQDYADEVPVLVSRRVGPWIEVSS